MNPFKNLVLLLVACVSLARLSKGDILEPFVSIDSLESKSTWIGIVRIMKNSNSAAQGATSNKYFCTSIINIKGRRLGGEKDKNIIWTIVDASARTDKSGAILKTISTASSFKNGEAYLVFMQDHGLSMSYVPVEGSVLQIPPGVEPESLRNLSVKDAFYRVVDGLELYFSRQAEHAKLQKDVFTR